MRTLLLVLAIANLGQAPAVKGGTVTGTVAAARGRDPVNNVEHLWVYLEGEGKPPTSKLGKDVVERIAQKNLTFSPRVLLIPRGATVFFPNRDSVEHNVFSPEMKSWIGFNLGRYNTDKVGKPKTFREYGEFDIFCDVHPEMSAAVKVVPSRYYTKVVDGTYTFTDVPPGVYRVVAWSPDSTETRSSQFAVEAGPTKPVQVQSMPFQHTPWDTTHNRSDGSAYKKLYP